MYLTLDVSKIRPRSPSNSPEICSSKRHLVGGLFTCLAVSPEHIRIQKLDSRNPDNIDKEVFFKFLVFSYKDITLMGIFLN